ncbi:hypothetical protein H2198_006369 [Neophaeococcomyces mojaviensis]|uniref:Uncharacterized protein n=1 Tax=Neophaeococcomyces mojaviensis TaxID=3383035 RepID=A0ACC3A3M7_9EURO|nr:hypothetical protein H2198_006369 [Knufia sp. JES_112]
MSTLGLGKECSVALKAHCQSLQLSIPDDETTIVRVIVHGNEEDEDNDPNAHSKDRKSAFGGIYAYRIILNFTRESPLLILVPAALLQIHPAS